MQLKVFSWSCLDWSKARFKFVHQNFHVFVHFFHEFFIHYWWVFMPSHQRQWSQKQTMLHQKKYLHLFLGMNDEIPFVMHCCVTNQTGVNRELILNKTQTLYNITKRYIHDSIFFNNQNSSHWPDLYYFLCLPVNFPFFIDLYYDREYSSSLYLLRVSCAW